MSNRSRPRTIVAASTRSGNTVASWPLILPVYRRSSSRSCPRATVPSTSGRAERESVKKVDSRIGMYFGWSCMSWRQPVTTIAPRTQRLTERTPRRRARVGVLRGSGDATIRALDSISVGNGRHLPRLERLEKPPRAIDVELRVDRLDAEEEPVAARERE